MPDPAPQPTPATPDELAALYLRARDVPCPGCGYNRRDGTTTTCPECSVQIQIVNRTRYLRTSQRLVVAAIATIFVASSSAVSGYFIYIVFTEPSIGTQFARRMIFGVLAVSLGFNLLALRATIALRREYPNNPGFPLFRLVIALAIAGILQTLVINSLIYFE